MYVIDSVIRNEGSNEAVIVCGGDTFRVTMHDLLSLGVNEGDRVGEEIYEEICSARDRLLCIKKAFDHLSYGDLSKKQLFDKLSKKFPKDLCADVADLFADRGYIDDARLAERYAETFYEFKNMGLGKIREQLYRRGISKEDIENALAKYSDIDQRGRIIAYIEKKYDTNALSDDKYRRKVYAGLMRAGFSGSDVADVLRNYEREYD